MSTFEERVLLAEAKHAKAFADQHGSTEGADTAWGNVRSAALVGALEDHEAAQAEAEAEAQPKAIGDLSTEEWIAHKKKHGIRT